MGVKAKIVSYEWGEYLAGMHKGEYDSVLYGQMPGNGDPGSFAGMPLSCNSIQIGSNAARWRDKSYDALVKKASLVGDPRARAKLYEQAREIFYQQTPWITLATGRTLYATRSNVGGYRVNVMGSDFSKTKLS